MTSVSRPSKTRTWRASTPRPRGSPWLPSHCGGVFRGTLGNGARFFALKHAVVSSVKGWSAPSQSSLSGAELRSHVITQPYCPAPNSDSHWGRSVWARMHWPCKEPPHWSIASSEQKRRSTASIAT